MHDVVTYSRPKYIGAPAVPILHSTHADKIIECCMCVYIAQLQLCYKDAHVQCSVLITFNVSAISLI